MLRFVLGLYFVLRSSLAIIMLGIKELSRSVVGWSVIVAVAGHTQLLRGG